jgi:MoxR-like ATPase
MATQNPIEQEGTYPLPEAQLDRFLLHVAISYPAEDAEREILRLARREASTVEQPSTKEIAINPISSTQLKTAREQVLNTYMADNLEDYLLQIILATRQPQRFGDDLAGWIQYGGSPRATIALDRCARSRAWLHGRDYVAPEDIKNVAFDVLRHRVLLTYEAEAEGITVDRLVNELLQRIPIP